MPQDLASLLKELVQERPGLEALRLLDLLRDRGHRVARLRELNRVLYRSTELEWHPGEGTKRLWYPRGWEEPKVADQPKVGEALVGPPANKPKRARAFGNPFEAHGRDCKCPAYYTIKDLPINGAARSIVERSVRSGPTASVAAVLLLDPSHLTNDVVNSLADALGSLAARPCATSLEEVVPVPWRNYTRPGLSTRDERWPDDWDGADWSQWIRGDATGDIGLWAAFDEVRHLQSQSLTELIETRRRSVDELVDVALANRSWEWNQVAVEDSAVEPTDWDEGDVLRVLSLARLGNVPLLLQTAVLRRVAERARRTSGEVLAFADYLSQIEAGDLAPDRRLARLLDAFPPDEPQLLVRRLEMMDSIGPSELVEPEWAPEEELIDAVEASFSLPDAGTFVAEDGGPNPLHVVRKLLPGGEGTRGRPPIVYTETLLDRVLLPELLIRSPTLVVLSGNAGDGKTAFIGQVLAKSEVELVPGLNEYSIELEGRPYLVVLDGSEDDESRTNDDLLEDALGEFRGAFAATPSRGTVIAINKGRLLSFLARRAAHFPFLWDVARQALVDGVRRLEHPYVLIDLNDRTTIGPNLSDAVLAGIISRLTTWSGWQEECPRCDAYEQCPVLFNIRSLSKPDVQRQVWRIFAAVDLDDRIHTTARHLVTKVASAVVAGSTCAEVRATVSSAGEFPPDAYFYNALYSSGERDASGDTSVMDRVTASYDPSELSSPSRDRRLAFHLVRGSVGELIGDDGLGHDAFLRTEGAVLERSSVEDKPQPGATEYRLQMLEFTRHVSRRLFHLDQDNALAPLFPMRTMDEFVSTLGDPEADLGAIRDRLVENLNATLGVERSTLTDLLAPRDYARGLSGRGFATLVPRGYFEVVRATKLGASYDESPYLESWPRAILLTATDPGRGHVASLVVPLLLYEVLDRAGRGFRPATQSERSFMVRLSGFYRRLTEHRWTVRPSYVLYDNGAVLAKAVIDGHKLTMAEI